MNLIPKHIFQTSPQPAVDYLRTYFYTHCPTWSYQHFTDYDILKFFSHNPLEEFPEIVKVFHSFEKGEHKADLFRYYYLYIHGGLFVDLDAIPVCSFDETIGDSSLLLVRGFQDTSGIYNGILGASPQNRLILEALRHCYYTPPSLLQDCYHFFCKNLLTLASIHKTSKTVILQELNRIDEGLGGSIIVDSSHRHLFTHYWLLGNVPVPSSLKTASVSKVRSVVERIQTFGIARLNMTRGLPPRVYRLFNFPNLQTPKKLDYSVEFQTVYDGQQWGSGSGPGSSVENTAPYNRFITDFLTTANVTQVTDIGCGDWQSTHLIYEEIGPIDYLGIDCTLSVINSNKNLYPFYSFKKLDAVARPDLIRDSQVYILKDVLQHLRTKDIYALLDQLTAKTFKYILVINDSHQQYDNEDLPNVNNVAHSRGVSSSYYPLKKYGAVPILKYSGGGDKEISIICNRTTWNFVSPHQTWAFQPQLLQVIDTYSGLQRIGPNSDGGYVIYGGLNYDLFISCGLACDIRFEEEFLRNHDYLTCLAFDGTINSLPKTTKPIKWIKKNIAGFPDIGETNLKRELMNSFNVFLKMDIEGSEFDWLAAMDTQVLNRIAQLVIEIHWPFDLFRSSCLAKLNRTHYPVHVHANNYNNKIIPSHLPSGRSLDGCTTIISSSGAPSTFPEVFEVTYLRKDLAPYPTVKIHKSFPTELDFPCCHLVPDIKFRI